MNEYCPTARSRVFWSAFDDAGLIAGTALKLILLTGQRPGEVAHMRREHIKDGWWEMPGAPDAASKWRGTKNGESHRVWLSAPVQELLAALEDDRDTGFVLSCYAPRPDHARNLREARCYGQGHAP